MGQAEDRARSRTRRRIRAALPFALFAGVVGLGFLAPVLAQVLDAPPARQPEARAPRAAVRDATPRRHPLLVPRDFSAGFVPELLDPDGLFRGSDGVTRLVGVPSFARSGGDAIFLDDVDRRLADLVLGSTAGDTSALDGWPLDGSHPDGPSPMHRIRPMDDIGVGGGPALPGIKRQLAPPPVVPEPGTGALLALGLAILGWCGRTPRRGTG